MTNKRTEKVNVTRSTGIPPMNGKQTDGGGECGEIDNNKIKMTIIIEREKA